MKRVIWIALMALIAVAVIVPANAAGKVTVGDFLTQIAQVKNLPATDGHSAAASLKVAGVNLPSLDLTATLNEGTVAQIAGVLGVNVTTNNPQAPFSQGQMDAFVSSFASEIVGTAPVEPPEASAADPIIQIRKRHRAKSVSEPE